jgi:peptide/nickel transport system permease protein
MTIVGSIFSATTQKVRDALSFILLTNSGRVALPLVLVFAVLTLTGPWLGDWLPHSPTYMPSPMADYQFLPPSSQFWLGTDQFGRDVFSRVLTGATSLVITASAGAGIGIVLGTVVGIGSGYKGGWVDEIVMRIMDMLMSFPTLLLALLVLFTLGPSRVNIAVTIGFVSMPTIGRVVRSTTLSLKTLEFVESARLRRESTFHIMFREILPNVMPVIGVEASVRLSYAILSVASLGYLGLGIQPPSPDWGLAIATGRQFLVSAPWIVVGPMVAISLLVIALNLLADGIRESARRARE